MKYQVQLAKGCHGKSENPIIGEYETWDEARTVALTSDRFVAVNLENGEQFQIPQQDDVICGGGRYGNGITLDEAIALNIW